MADDRRAKQEAMIAKLLRKAESVGPAEAETLTETATRFMIKYGIESINLEAARLGQDRTIEEIVTKVIEYKGVYAKAYCIMANAVMDALGEMRGFTRSKYRSSDLDWVMVGYEGDVNNAVTLLNSLALQAVIAVDAHIKKDWLWTDYTASEKYNVKRSFLVGFGSGAASRIRNAKRVVVQEASVSSPGTELMLIDRGNAVNAFTDKEYPDLRKGRTTKIVNSGYGAGHQAGLNANTGGTAVGGKKVIGG